MTDFDPLEDENDQDTYEAFGGSFTFNPMRLLVLVVLGLAFYYFLSLPPASESYTPINVQPLQSRRSQPSGPVYVGGGRRRKTPRMTPIMEE